MHLKLVHWLYRKWRPWLKSLRLNSHSFWAQESQHSPLKVLGCQVEVLKQGADEWCSRRVRWLLAKWRLGGYRGVRVGEAANPGPEKRVAALRAAALLKDLVKTDSVGYFDENLQTGVGEVSLVAEASQSSSSNRRQVVKSTVAGEQAPSTLGGDGGEVWWA